MRSVCKADRIFYTVLVFLQKSFKVNTEKSSIGFIQYFIKYVIQFCRNQN